MKRTILLFLSAILIFGPGCTSYWGVIKEGRPSADIRKYSTINVGWLDMGENKWKDYGYDNQAQWAATIDHMNKEAMPAYFKQHLPEKKVNVAAARGTNPAEDGLVIKFSNANYVQRTSTGAKIMFGAFAGSDTLDLTIHFIDGKSGSELHQVEVSIYSKAFWDVSGWGFEGRVNNCIANLVYYIIEQVK